MIDNTRASIEAQIDPFVSEKTRRLVKVHGDSVPVSFGKEETGYGITLGEDVTLHQGYAVLGVSAERVAMRNTQAARLIGKSTWARLGIHPNVTEIEPGWSGYITLELTYLPLWQGLFMHWANLIVPRRLFLPAGTGIGVLQWADLKEPAKYHGPYEGQPPRPMGHARSN